MTDSEMGRFAREDVLAVLARFGITSAKRAVGPDPTEEVILLRTDDFACIDPAEVALAIMDVLPHTKVLVIEEHPAWETEPL